MLHDLRSGLHHGFSHRFESWRNALRGAARLMCGIGAFQVSFAASDFAELKKLSIEELMEIEVTSVSRSPIAFASAPSALQVLTQRDIQRSGASGIPQALRLMDNLNVAQKNAHDWAISARGFNTELANKLLVMIDGRTVYTPLFSGVRWDAQDYLMEDIDRIEAISGPGGALWGANAVNGVINVTTKNSKDTQGLYAEAGAGNQLRSFSSVRYGGKLASNVHYRVYAKQLERGDEVVASGMEVNDGSRMLQGGFRLDSDISSGGAVTIQGDFYHGYEGVPLTAEGKIAGGNLLGRWSQELSNGSDLQLQVYYDRTFLRQPYAASLLGAAGSFSDQLETYDLDFQHTIAHSRRVFVWGLGYRLTRDETKAAPSVGFVPSQVDQNLFSAFVQEQFSLGERVLLTVGTKLEHNDYTGLEVIPNLRVQRDLAQNHMVWAAVSRAVRAPSRVDRDIRQPSAGLTILSGGPDFESETVVAYEAGYRGRLGQRLLGSVSLFLNEYRNIRSLTSTPATIVPLYFANDLEGNTHGIELTFDYDLAVWWRLHGGYTFLKSDLRVRPGGVDLNNALNETSDPENQLALGSSMDLPGGIEFDAHLRWIDTLENNDNGSVGTVPSYLSLNVRLGMQLTKHCEISLVGNNLLDDHHPEFGLPGVNRVEIRRSIFAKLAWRY